MATGVTGLKSSRLFYIFDTNHKYRFLVDTGAEVSVLPPSPADRKHQDGFNLLAVNGSGIATFGKRSLTLNLRLRRTFRWVFVIAEVHTPILGADFAVLQFASGYVTKSSCRFYYTTESSRHIVRHNLPQPFILSYPTYKHFHIINFQVSNYFSTTS